ncbi:MAG: GNAT family N-acetyltransferase [Planctomycetota bacterium]|mgnify:CR=1 FL=1|nr:MAG: GNAT family N-acetyltransferase [Planctomycetota bacterium]REJ92155.1 MAG: GNAT family N-acetyltransferase [Planctomycetota bacterium]REK28691.1 MAG: GNAT family N-acetyltransferase [Planctomycetota bacterium]REK39305.1 MAG: GNAT family N-acetyltransferase [Planctomycetota bacterium]
MSIRNLDHLFLPESIAVIGASRRPRSVGATVMKNLLAGGFEGPIMPVNPKYDAVCGVLAWPNVAELPRTPDLAVICTPPRTVPGLIAELGERGTKAAVVLTAGLGAREERTGKTFQQSMLEAARSHMLRVLGPNCVGLIIPTIGLNASFAHATIEAGKIAFVSQSGALATAVLDWARTKEIGFSHFVSLGNSADVDFGDVLDFLGSEPTTRSILLYIESIKHARKFMSAARAAARNKPVIVLKAGRVAEGAKAAASHTGALAGSDNVYDAAIRRAGMLRVYSIEDLFDAVETLGRAKPVLGDRLAILTNGGGPGVMATDVAIARGARIAGLSEQTMNALDAVLPATWSKGNPVDIIGDAPAERYRDALGILSRDADTDAILFIHAPTAIVPSDSLAEALVPDIKETRKPLFACWLGGDAVAKARRTFAQAGIPTYDTPEDAVNAFIQIVDYRRNQETLMETPPSVSEDFTPDVATARQIIERNLAAGHDLLTEPDAKAILAAYRISTVETRIGKDAKHCVRLAAEIGFPVAVKILSPNITHKSDVGGVALDLESAEQVEAAVAAMLGRIEQLKPAARVDGFTVQAMARRPDAHELIVGASEDPIFGPVVLFGQGGTAVEVIGDRAVTLPPLNVPLARELVSRTRVSKLLAGYRHRPPADLADIYRTIIQVSQLISDIPEVAELDINPLLADETGVLALDARLRVVRAETTGSRRLAIRPYPRGLEEEITFDNRPLTIRPIRPEDEPSHRELFTKLHPDDIRFRFFGLLREPVHSELARYTQIDYEREMAFIATRPNENGELETLGVARVIADPDNISAEFAIVVRSELKGKGLGSILLQKLIDYCRERGTSRIIGHVLAHNTRMLALAEKFGFQLAEQSEEDVIEVCLPLKLG